MKMSTKSITTATSSSLATVSAPLIGDEYVLVKKTKDEKEIKEVSVKPMKLKSESLGVNFGSGGGRFGACKALLTYDFSFTPSTSSVVSTVVALAPSTDASFTSYWRKLFSVMRMDKAEVEFDMTEFINPVGHDFALSPVVIAYKPMANATTMTYAEASDLKTAVFAKYSVARPVVTYKVPKSWFIGWSLSAEATSIDLFLPKWTSTESNYTPHMGFVHFCSQKVMFDTERTVVGRLKMWMSFRGQL